MELTLFFSKDNSESTAVSSCIFCSNCKVMHTGNKNNEFSYEMNGKVLDKVLIEKDLGIPAI